MSARDALGAMSAPNGQGAAGARAEPAIPPATRYHANIPWTRRDRAGTTIGTRYVDFNDFADLAAAVAELEHDGKTMGLAVLTASPGGR